MRIAVNPSDLRDMVGALNRVDGDGSAVDAELAQPLPEMPGYVAARVEAEIRSVRGTLRLRTSELAPAKQDLLRRAAWAELVTSFDPGISAPMSRALPWRRLVDLWRSTARNLHLGRSEFRRIALAHSGDTVVSSLAAGAKSFERIAEDLGNVANGKYVFDLAKYAATHRPNRIATLHGAIWKLGRMAPKAPGILDVAGAGADVLKLVSHSAAGDTHKMEWDAWHVGLDVAGVAFPEAGFAIGAFEVGWTVGAAAAPPLAAFTESETIGALYDGKTADQLTPTEASQYAHRYDGIKGAGHFAEDVAGAPVQAAARFLFKHFGRR